LKLLKKEGGEPVEMSDANKKSIKEDASAKDSKDTGDLGGKSSNANDEDDDDGKDASDRKKLVFETVKVRLDSLELRDHVGGCV
jgi:hypothetical protein